MSKKNKLMLAAAVIAVLLLVGSGVARCSLVREDVESTNSAIEAVEKEEAPTSQQGAPAEGHADTTAGLEALVGTSWTGIEDPTYTLSIVKGAFVEAKDGQTSVTYWTLDAEEATDTTVTATVLASKSLTEAASPSLVTVATEGADTVLRTDALSCSYKKVRLGERTLSFTGVTSKLEEAMGVEAAKIEAAVSARAAAVSPNASRAIWDAEAWIDYANGAATTTFTLDDGASTMISVTRASDGTIEAL